MGSGVGQRATTDAPVTASDGNTRLAAEGGYGDGEPLHPVEFRLGLGQLCRPARVSFLLWRLRGRLRPDLAHRTASLDLRLLSVSVALTRRVGQRCLDDLPRRQQIAHRTPGAVQASEQRIHR